jgi:hypothetical protein
VYFRSINLGAVLDKERDVFLMTGRPVRKLLLNPAENRENKARQ